MELVVVNGASNIAKQTIRQLTAGGAYNRVRLLDFNPFRKSVYDFQREMAAQGVTVEKRMAQSSQKLEIEMEGAEHVLYFTH
jgi:exonuclease V gamma subunit